MKAPLKYPYSAEKTTVKIAEDWVMNNATEGAECPCCGQLVKVYRRKLYSSMAYALTIIYLTKTPDDGWIHVPRLLNGHGTVARGGDFAKLIHWDLLEAHKKDSGYYRITQRGRDFVQCRIVVPSAVYIYDGERLGYDHSQMITIIEAMGSKFNYEELMQAAAG